MRREQTRFNPIHYLSLLEQKPGGFDHASRLEAELQSAGTRELIKVLRLLERHPIPTLKRVVEHALAIDAPRASAIRLILEYQQESPLTLFSLEGRPHLKQVQVTQTDVSAYQYLLIGG